MVLGNNKKLKKKIPLFTSYREKYLWGWVLLIIIAIFSTLFIGKPLANQLRDQDVQAIFFGIGLLLVTVSVISYGVQTSPGKIEMSTLIGVIAVYLLFIFRLGAPERSHLIEFSVLAVFIHKAFIERSQQKKLLFHPAFFALITTFFIGVVDESIQLFLPNRVFDLEDLIFNGIAALMAVFSNLLLTWTKKRFKRQ